MRRIGALVAVAILAGCSGTQEAVVQHFCEQPIEVMVVWTIDDSDYPQPSVLVAPEIPTEVWAECCDPSPSGQVWLSAGEWSHVDDAKDYSFEDVIAIPAEGC